MKPIKFKILSFLDKIGILNHTVRCRICGESFKADQELMEKHLVEKHTEVFLRSLLIGSVSTNLDRDLENLVNEILKLPEDKRP